MLDGGLLHMLHLARGNHGLPRAQRRAMTRVFLQVARVGLAKMHGNYSLCETGST